MHQQIGQKVSRFFSPENEEKSTQLTKRTKRNSTSGRYSKILGMELTNPDRFAMPSELLPISAKNQGMKSKQSLGFGARGSHQLLEKANLDLLQNMQNTNSTFEQSNVNDQSPFTSMPKIKFENALPFDTLQVPATSRIEKHKPNNFLSNMNSTNTLGVSPSTSSINLANRSIKKLSGWLDSQEIEHKQALEYEKDQSQKSKHIENLSSIYSKAINAMLNYGNQGMQASQIESLTRRIFTGLQDLLPVYNNLNILEINNLKDRVEILEKEKAQLNEDFEKFKQNESVDAYFSRLQMRSIGEDQNVETIRNEIMLNVDQFLAQKNLKDGIQKHKNRFDFEPSGVDTALTEVIRGSGEVFREQIKEPPMLSLDFENREKPQIFDQIKDLIKDESHSINMHSQKYMKDKIAYGNPKFDAEMQTEVSFDELERGFKRKIAMYEFEVKDLTNKMVEERGEFDKQLERTKKELKKSQEFMNMYKEKLQKEIEQSRNLKDHNEAIMNQLKIAESSNNALENEQKHAMKQQMEHIKLEEKKLKDLEQSIRDEEQKLEGQAAAGLYKQPNLHEASKKAKMATTIGEVLESEDEKSPPVPVKVVPAKKVIPVAPKKTPAPAIKTVKTLKPPPQKVEAKPAPSKVTMPKPLPMKEEFDSDDISFQYNSDDSGDPQMKAAGPLIKTEVTPESEPKKPVEKLKTQKTKMTSALKKVVKKEPSSQQVAAQKEADDKIEQLTVELDELKFENEKLKQMTTEFEELKLAQDDFKQLQVQNDELQGQIERLNAEIEVLNARPEPVPVKEPEPIKTEVNQPQLETTNSAKSIVQIGEQIEDVTHDVQLVDPMQQIDIGNLPTSAVQLVSKQHSQEFYDTQQLNAISKSRESQQRSIVTNRTATQKSFKQVGRKTSGNLNKDITLNKDLSMTSLGRSIGSSGGVLPPCTCTCGRDTCHKPQLQMNQNKKNQNNSDVSSQKLSAVKTQSQPSPQKVPVTKRKSLIKIQGEKQKGDAALKTQQLASLPERWSVESSEMSQIVKMNQEHVTTTHKIEVPLVNTAMQTDDLPEFTPPAKEDVFCQWEDPDKDEWATSLASPLDISKQDVSSPGRQGKDKKDYTDTGCGSQTVLSDKEEVTLQDKCIGSEAQEQSVQKGVGSGLAEIAVSDQGVGTQEADIAQISMASNKVVVMQKRASELKKSQIENPAEEYLPKGSVISIDELVNQKKESINMIDAGSSPMPESLKKETDLTIFTKNDHLSMNQTQPIGVAQSNVKWNQQSRENNGTSEKRHSLLNVDIVKDSYDRNSEYCDTEEINKSVKTPPRRLKNGDKGKSEKIDDKNMYGLNLDKIKEKIPVTAQFSSFSAGSENHGYQQLKQRFDQPGQQKLKTELNIGDNDTTNSYPAVQDKLNYTDSSEMRAAHIRVQEHVMGTNKDVDVQPSFQSDGEIKMFDPLLQQLNQGHEFAHGAVSGIGPLKLPMATQTDNKTFLKQKLAEQRAMLDDEATKRTLETFTNALPTVSNYLEKHGNTFPVDHATDELYNMDPALLQRMQSPTQVNKNNSQAKLTNTSSLPMLNSEERKIRIQRKKILSPPKRMQFIALKDFSRYGNHTLELNTEVKQRITVRHVGRVGGGFAGMGQRSPVEGQSQSPRGKN